MNGIIFDVKRFAVHDGGGLRSTLFLKGCPLHCPWCQNPEGINPKPDLWYSPTDCLKCKTCVQACPNGALTFADDRIHLLKGKCVLCETCVDACPAAILKRMGREVSEKEASEMLLRDRLFFGETGGVTLSGGEILMQWRFAVETLRLCKEAGVDTAVETSLFAGREAIEALIPVVDHFMIDIKILDAAKHKEIIGVDNAVILSNYEYLVEKGCDIVVRTPLIPGFTADEENIRAIARYIKSVDSEAKYELLNFNPLCKSKYAALEKDYPVEGKALSTEEMDTFYRILEEENIKYIIKE